MSFKPPYRYLTASSLASTLSSSPVASSSSASPSSLPRKDIAIIDVRDDDFEGGNIVGARNVPSNEFNEKVKGLVQELKDGESAARSKRCNDQAILTIASLSHPGDSPNNRLPLLPLPTARSQISSNLYRNKKRSSTDRTD